MIDYRRVTPVLLVSDMQRSIDWYVGRLEFAQEWRSDADGGGENCMLTAGPLSLMLSTGSHLGDRPEFTGTLYFEVSGIDVIWARLKDVLDVVWPLEEMPYGMREFGVRDPDGYLIALSEPQG